MRETPGTPPGRQPNGRRRPIFYLIDTVFLAIALMSISGQWVRNRMPMGDVPNPHFPGCGSQAVNMHWSFVPGRISCADDVPWGWLLEFLGNSLGRGNPSAFIDGTDLFFGILVIYAFGHAIYAIFRIAYLATQRRL
ncbi:hypothetical protein [Nioella aestuarii]|uniref:hypothetical protein n=1 Tax=Nioella aestuarii TaxID=1662864 RepID=UPI003D7FC3D7